MLVDIERGCTIAFHGEMALEEAVDLRKAED
jgi:hypothetical protein